MDEDLRSELEGMTPKSRDLLSRVMTGDQVDRDTVVRSLMRYRADSPVKSPSTRFDLTMSLRCSA